MNKDDNDAAFMAGRDPVWSGRGRSSAGTVRGVAAEATAGRSGGRKISSAITATRRGTLKQIAGRRVGAQKGRDREDGRARTEQQRLGHLR